MGKRLFLLLICSLIEVALIPQFLAASDSVAVTGIDNAKITETVLPPEPEPEPAVEVAEASYQTNNAISSSVRATQTQTAIATVARVETYTPPADTISVAGRTLNIYDVGDTSVDSGNHVNKYGAKFLYGHNSAGVFGGLVGLGVGSRFSVTYGGKTTNYTVAKVMIYEKNSSNGKLQLNGQGNYMASVAKAVDKDTGVAYSLSLMTCYGTSYGNGDASHRLVIFANAR